MHSKELKSTIILPKTGFSIKRKNQRDEEIISFWESNNIYNKANIKNKNDIFIIHDGPPYSNGLIHIGHFVNRVLKDFSLRFHNSLGKKTPFILGWDTHGLPIEFKVLNDNKNKSLEKSEIRDKCKEYALEQILLQKKQLRKIGLLTDLNNYYSTQDFNYQAKELEILATIVRKGLIYRGLKPVYWSWSNKTALAENEVEYIDKTDFSLFFKVKLRHNIFNYHDVHLLVWTTQPWTILFNKLIAVNSKESYLLVNSNSELLIFSEFFFENSELINKSNFSVEKKFSGEKLLGLNYFHVYEKENEREINHIIDNEHVIATEGTGILHIAPSCGPEDFEFAKREKINIFEPSLNEEGKIVNSHIEELKGTFYQSVNKWVLDDLSGKSLIFELKNFVHSYPCDWRDKTPVIYRLTEQWFINLSPLKEEIKNNIEKVKWLPNYSKTKIISFIENRDEWCISRQRYWGLPIPAIIINGKHELIPEIVEYAASIVKSKGSDFWFNDKAVKIIINEKFHKLLANKSFEIGKETLDVWFDSGVSSFSALKSEHWPANLYLEGSDQFRGWFNSSLIISTIMNKIAPYKEVVSHGFTVDKSGKKMSKSLGNTVEINQLIETFGLDVMRLWVSSFDFTKEIKVSNEIISKNKEVYNKLRNTIRFIIGNLNSSPNILNEEFTQFNEFSELSKYILSKTWQLAIQSKNEFLNYKFSNIYNSLNNFCVNNLSSFYFDIIKDNLYCDNLNSRSRKEIISVLYSILQILLKIISPLTPVLSEEAYKEVKFRRFDDFFDNESVHLTQFPNSLPCIKWPEEECLKFEKYLIPLRRAIFQEFEKTKENKDINSISQIKITITLNNYEQFQYLKSISDELPSIFLVSEIILKNNKESLLEIEKTNKNKCLRCWRFKVIKGNNCNRCSKEI